jgi:hypothetical protein
MGMYDVHLFYDRLSEILGLLPALKNDAERVL